MTTKWKAAPIALALSAATAMGFANPSIALAETDSAKVSTVKISNDSPASGNQKAATTSSTPTAHADLVPMGPYPPLNVWKALKCEAAIVAVAVPYTGAWRAINEAGGVAKVYRILKAGGSIGSIEKQLGTGAATILGIDQIKKNCF